MIFNNGSNDGYDQTSTRIQLVFMVSYKVMPPSYRLAYDRH